ncbi:hypothetical protein HanPI659440_Chr09g0318791 [Helianthus annuus]|nr:hypothetical protein HanPI659440_Chr09g0318791 [Helianthus annuus]
MTSNKLAKYMFELAEANYDNGWKDGFAKGKMFAIEKRPDHTFEFHKTDCATRFLNRRQEFITWSSEFSSLLRSYP